MKLFESGFSHENASEIHSRDYMCLVHSKGEGKPCVIRPLALVPEELIRECAALMDLPEAGVCCYKEQLNSGDRKYFAGTLAQWEQRIPDLRSNIARSLMNPEVEHLLCPPEKQ